MLKTKVIACDLDGTLLYCKKFISKKNIYALTNYINSGGIVCFVTGRSLASTMQIADYFYKKTGLSIQYLSCLKGTILYDNINKKVLDSKLIDHTVAQEILALSQENKLTFSIYLNNDINNKNMMVVGNNWFLKLFHLLGFFKHYHQINDLADNNLGFKINISNFLLPFKLKRIGQKIKDNYKNKVDLSRTSKFLYEITPNGCNKGTAIQKISKLTNIDLKNFAALGDSENDIEIFEQVGVKIAIGRHSPRLHAISNYVIKFNQRNAVAKAINSYLLKK